MHLRIAAHTIDYEFDIEYNKKKKILLLKPNLRIKIPRQYRRDIAQL